jgi:predicted PurR-regulated permease PerM
MSTDVFLVYVMQLACYNAFMENNSKKVSVEISMNTIFKVIVILAVLGFVYLIRDIVAIVFFSILLILLLQPGIAWLGKFKIPKGLAVLIIYTLLFGFVALAVTLVIPPIIGESQLVVETVGQYSAYISSQLGLDMQVGADQVSNALGSIQKFLPDATFNIFSQLTAFIGAIVTLVIVLVITFYGLVEESAFKRIIRSFVPSEYQPYLYHVATNVQRKLGMWLRGQLLLGLVIFILTYIGLVALNVEYALVLALLAGILEFIPYVGPIVSGALAVFLTIFVSPIKALLVVVLFMIIQQIENHVLVPKIMQRTTGLNPVISIIALLIGGKLGGVIGLLLAIPVTLVVSVFLNDLMGDKVSNQLEIEE